MISVGKFYRFIFLLYLLVVSILPVQKYKTTSFFSLDIPLNYICLFGLILFFFPLWLYRGEQKTSSKTVFLIFNIILAMALVSVLYNDNIIYKRIEYYALFITWGTATFSYLSSKTALSKTIDPRKTIKLVTSLLTSVFLFYIIWWVFKFHMQSRLGGMLGVSSILYTPMIIILAVHLSNIATKHNRMTSIIGALITSTAILLTNSRAGLICIGLLLLFYLVQRLTIIKIIGMIALVGICFLIISKVSTFDRYQNFNDIGRQENIQTALNISTSSTKYFVLGSGYGSVWRAEYYLDNNMLDAATSYETMINTYYGRILHHPHSSFLKIFVELGIVGLIIFLTIFIIICRECYKSWKCKNQQRMYILFSVLCTGTISFTTDFYLFANWEISLIWWFFLFFGLSCPLAVDQEINHTDYSRNGTGLYAQGYCKLGIIKRSQEDE